MQAAVRVAGETLNWSEMKRRVIRAAFSLLLCGGQRHAENVRNY